MKELPPGKKWKRQMKYGALRFYIDSTGIKTFLLSGKPKQRKKYSG